MPKAMSDHLLFLKEFRRTFHTTGALLPSSPGLARALARYVATDDSTSRRILEVGPGTGAVTGKIIARMGPDDHLDLVELNDEFVARLEQRFELDEKFRSVADRSEILHRNVLDLPEEPKYDCIVSGLPLNNFAAEDVDAILSALRKLLKPGGTLSFFEYIAVRSVRGALARGAERTRLRGISSILGRLLADHEIRRDAIALNVPPAWVHHVQFADKD